MILLCYKSVKYSLHVLIFFHSSSFSSTFTSLQSLALSRLPALSSQSKQPAMHSAQQLAIVALFASLVSAAPLQDAVSARSPGTFAVTQVKNPTFKNFVASGPAAYAKALSKFKAPMSSDLAAVVSQATQSGKFSHLGDKDKNNLIPSRLCCCQPN